MTRTTGWRLRLVLLAVMAALLVAHVATLAARYQTAHAQEIELPPWWGPPTEENQQELAGEVRDGEGDTSAWPPDISPEPSGDSAADPDPGYQDA